MSSSDSDDDLRAAIGLQFDQMLGGQQAERLAQRRARRAQPVAQRALVQAGAGRQFALDDHFAQAIGQRFGERRGAAAGRSGGTGPVQVVRGIHVGIPSFAYGKNAKPVGDWPHRRIFPLAKA